MKRALVVLLAFVGFSAFGIGTFSGKWDFQMCMPGGVSKNTLSVTYNEPSLGMSFTSDIDLVKNTFAFGIKGNLGGIIDLTGKLNFSFFAPDYDSATFTAKMTFAGIEVSATIDHYSADDLPTTWSQYCATKPTVGLMLFKLNAKIAPLALDLIFADCCPGIAFNSIKVTLTGLELCCGIKYGVEWSFLKSGFDYAKFTLDPLFELCCGINFGLEVKFGTTYKAVTPKFTYKFPGADCLDVGVTLGTVGTRIDDLKIDFVGIKCSLGDCNSFLAGTSFTFKPDTVDADVGRPIRIPGAWDYVGVADTNGDGVIDTAVFELTAGMAQGTGWGLRDWHYQAIYAVIDPEDPETWVLEGYKKFYEYETIQLSLCGPGCCGGQYKANIKAYFGEELFYDAEEAYVGRMPSLFGLSRIAADVSVPVMTNFALNLSVEYILLAPLFDELYTPYYKVCFGWTFSF